MNPSAVIPPLTLGQIPTIGMVTAPSSAGHVGIGIGIPIMTATGGPILHQRSPPVSQQPTQHEFVSPDSSEDFLGGQSSQSPILHPPSGQHGNVQPPPWPGQFLAGLGYPLMGMTSPLLLGEANMYYGNGLNFLSTHPHAHPPQPGHGHMNDLSLTLQQPNPVLGSVGLAEQVTMPQPKEMVPQIHSGPVKEIIHCKSCTLFPPNPSAPLPTTRDKPSGCRTVFVGGLPDNMTEDMVREAFEHCGEITTVRMSKKNFCHIRFQSECYVEGAIYLSGYRIRIGSNSECAYLGRFHVDYAQARDDFYEWECRQRQHQRQQRHRHRVEQERFLPPSPPPIVHFSEHEANTLAEHIKVNEHFGKSVQTLITWLERGDCSKKNSAMFYSMVQSTNSHIKRLIHEKSANVDELRKAKALANQRNQGIAIQFSQVEKVFLAASHKKVWDHFTKPQRKNIETWKKQVLEILSLQNDEHRLPGRGSDDMDFSDSDKEDLDHSDLKRRRTCEEDSHKSINQLREENDSLRCQLEAFKNEMDLIKDDFKSELEQKEAQITTLQTSQLIPVNKPSNESCTNSTLAAQAQSSPTQSDIPVNRTEFGLTNRNYGIEAGTSENPNLKVSRFEINCDSSSTSNQVNCNQSNCNQSNQNSISTITASTSTISSLDARLIGIISTFLNVHPFGASLDYIGSFVQKVLPIITLEQIQSLLIQFPGIFKQELSGIGATLERKWSFLGFSKD